MLARPSVQSSVKRERPEGQGNMTIDRNDPWLLIGAVLQELAADTEAVLHIARALDDQVTRTESHATPQKLREMAALSKSAALALVLAAANVVGATERLTIVAAFAEDDEGDGGLLS